MMSLHAPALPSLRTLRAARTACTAAAMLVLAAAVPAFAASGDAPFKPDLAKGQQLAATCVACHTADGTRGVAANPILQGQHPEYLVKQLQEFKNGKRKSAVMAGFAATLSDDDMRHVAAFYASKKPVNGVARNKDSVLLGEQIWRGGIMNKGVPACAACHSPNGAGLPALYPRIGGQHADYTEQQLLQFRSGERGNNPQMTTIADKMSDREIKAVADFVAGLR